MSTDPNATARPAKPPRRWPWILGLALVGFGIFAYTQLTIFVIQPIGAVPEGRTIVMWRLGKLKFIDSADAACAREMGGVNLLCRGGMLAGVSNNADIIVRLPYSETLYMISTGGKTYDR
jgi:hypothetical protein